MWAQHQRRSRQYGKRVFFVFFEIHPARHQCDPWSRKINVQSSPLSRTFANESPLDRKKVKVINFFYVILRCFIFFVVTLSPNARDDVVHRGVAQLVAHLVWDQVVARSSRVTPTPISRASVPDAMLDVSGTGFGERLSPLGYTKRGCLWQHCLMHWQPR